MACPLVVSRYTVTFVGESATAYTDSVSNEALLHGAWAEVAFGTLPPAREEEEVQYIGFLAGVY